MLLIIWKKDALLGASNRTSGGTTWDRWNVKKGSGYSYLNRGRDPMREYHVDCFEPEKSEALLQQLVTTDFGGNLSVRLFDSLLKP
jgi:hypothetical protein